MRSGKLALRTGAGRAVSPAPAGAHRRRRRRDRARERLPLPPARAAGDAAGDGTRTSTGTSTSGNADAGARGGASARAKIDALIEESAQLLREGDACDPEAAAVRAGQAAALIRRAAPVSLSDAKDAAERQEEVERLLAGVEDTRRLAEVWAETKGAPRPAAGPAPEGRSPGGSGPRASGRRG